MLTQISFCNPSTCTKIATSFQEWADLDGYDEVLTKEVCEHAADQFGNAREKGGEYFSNIIRSPHFTMPQIDAILERI